MDLVAPVAARGDLAGIASGTTRPAEDADSRAMADRAAAVIAASGLLEEGFSFQTGVGGISFATARAVGRETARRGR